MRSVAVILGVPVDDVTMPETVDRVCAFVEAGRDTGRTHQVATVNVDFIVNAVADRTARHILQRSDLAIPDGAPVLWAARLLGRPLRERVAGADLVPALAARSAQRGYHLYLFGAGPGVAEQAAEMLRDRHPGLHVTGFGGPHFDAVEDMDPEVLDRIRAERPDIVCVALGNPKQERWIDMYRERLGSPVFIGIGGTLDFIVGRKRRAPAWMSRYGLEWVHRMVTEPRRLAKRYLRDLMYFGPLLLLQVVRMGRRRGGGRAEVTAAGSDGASLRLKGPLDLQRHPLRPDEIALLGSGRDLTVDLDGMGRIDHQTAASLFALEGVVSREGGALHLAAGDERTLAGLRRSRLDGHFSLCHYPAGRNRHCCNLDRPCL